MIAARLSETVDNARPPDANELLGFSKALISGKGQEISAAELGKYPSIQRLLGTVHATGVVASDEAVTTTSPKPTAKAADDASKR